MDRLKFGTYEVQGDVYQSSARVGARQVPALEIVIRDEISRDALTAMQQHDMVICGENGETLGTQRGYHSLMRHSVILAKVTDAEQELAEAQDALLEGERERRQLEAENAALLFENLTGEVA